MSSYPNPPSGHYPLTNYEPPATNGLGVAGFALSLTGLIACGGLLCPIGLILSLFGLTKEPRGFAIAGTIIGFLGSVLAGIVLFFFASAINGFTSGSWLGIDPTVEQMWNATYEIDDYYTDNSDTLPDEATGCSLVAPYTDEWGTPIQYRPSATGTSNDYELISAGEDGTFDTGDDIIQSFMAYNMSSAWPPTVTTTPDTPEVSKEAIEESFAFATQIINESAAPGQPLPSVQAGSQMLLGVVDVWGEPIRYRPIESDPTRFHLQSAGPNKVWEGGDNDDLISTRDFVPAAAP